MVKICDNTYSEQDETKYKEYFNGFPYSLAAFQKHSIQGLVDGNHVLVTAHTGSGKSTPFEFAVDYFVRKGKRIIYCSPVKSLSNQKFYNLTSKYPDISVGIITGDIKLNQEASLLIVTTEILHNTLFLKKQLQPVTSNANMLSFEMDIDNELACVVFDEFHYLNDPDRGHVWENTIMMLPPQVQLLMLSATLDKPLKIGEWIENRTEPKSTVIVASTTHRPVPLIHYNFITTTQGIFKAINGDKALEKQIKDMTNKPIVIQSANGIFDEPHYHKMKKTLQLFHQKNVYMKRSFVLNKVCQYMVENNLLPCICFILSRKQVDIAATEITVPLLEDDSKVGYNIKREADAILRRLPNYQEYLELPEYIELIGLLEKGIGKHHSGMIPILREIVELFLDKGYIKLLFATETVAIGVNFPIKTTIFTDINKFDGSHMRMLHSHEYSQMSGRSGRLNIDTVGHVIHLNNLFKHVELQDYKNMMSGKPQRLSSKFKVSYNLLLSLIDIGDYNFTKYASQSMIQDDINSELLYIQKDLERVETELGSMPALSEGAHKEVVRRYTELQESRVTAVNKRRKEIDREIEEIKQQNKGIEADKEILINHDKKLAELTLLQADKSHAMNYLSDSINVLLSFLQDEGFILSSLSKPSYSLTEKGNIAVKLREVHCLVFAEMIANNKFDKLTATQLVAIFSCFTNVNVAEECQQITIEASCSVKTIIDEIDKKYQYYQDMECSKMMNTGMDYTHHFDLISYVEKWCECTTKEECKWVLQQLEQEKNVFLGEFVKAILKINNIACEMEKVAEHMGNIELLSKLKNIPLMTLKFVAMNQSLYTRG